MKKILLSISALLFSLNSIYAQVVNEYPKEIASLFETTATHRVVYNIQEQKAEDTDGDDYVDTVSFTVTGYIQVHLHTR